ncbi:MAG TPA: cupin [Rheinheimera sp.]|nr:cupin [Rheinheimera sp.]
MPSHAVATKEQQRMTDTQQGTEQHHWQSFLPDVEALDAHGMSWAALEPQLRERDTPLLLKGFAAHLPLAQHQSAESLLAHLTGASSGQLVNASFLSSETQGRVFYREDFQAFNFQSGRIGFADLAKRLLTLQADGGRWYMGSTEIGHYFPALVDELDLGLAALKPLTSLWLGQQSRIAAHQDFPANLACNLYGRRRFTLLPPEQVANLYPGPFQYAPGGQDVSLVDFAAPDLAKFPRFALAMRAAVKADLAQGDALFLPSMWWHQVDALDDLNLLLTHWWRDTPAYLGRPTNALMHAVLSIRSLPKAQREAFKALFDYYVFDEPEQAGALLPDSAKGLLELPLPEPLARALRADLTAKLQR